jgi:hypothetical protein
MELEYRPEKIISTEADVGIVPSNNPCPLPFTSFSVHHSLIILQLGTTDSSQSTDACINASGNVRQA